METKDKIDLIRKIAKKNNITAYDIGKNTEISLTSARNVLEEDNISPRTKTLNIILNYLQKDIVNTTGNTELKEEYTTEFRNRKVAESPEDYKIPFKDLKIDDKLNIIHKELQDIKRTIQKN